ncbi:MAG: ATP-binding protein [Zestosphaera sp.]
MLFDPRPKESRKDLFDRESELMKLRSSVELGPPITLCTGVRRSGKTSLIKTFISEYGYPALYLDVRRLADYGYSRAGFLRLVAEGFSEYRSLLDKLRKYLDRVKGVRISHVGVEFEWGAREPPLTSMLEQLNKYAEKQKTVFLIVFDEAQELRFLTGYRKLDVRKIVAWSYDTLHHVKFVLTGSEVGLLHEFLGFNKPSSPLYGRAKEAVVVDRFPREKAIEFLEVGFSEAGFSPQRETLEVVVEKLDGIPGWLALYGYVAVQKKRFDVFGEVFEEAVTLALSELSKLKKYSDLYSHVLRAVAIDCNTWKCIKSYVETKTNRSLTNTRLYHILKNLADLSILAKKNDEYVFLDPVYKEASKRI